MRIQDLPTQALRNRAEELRRKSGSISDWLYSAFYWERTKERHLFWRLCNGGQFEAAAKLQPKYFAEP